MGPLKSARMWLATLAVGLVLLLAMWPRARLADIRQAGRGDVRETIDAEGRTRLVDRYVITAPVNAVARRLALRPGDPVHAGSVLVVLDPVAAAPLDPRSRANAEAAVAAARARAAAAAENEQAVAAALAQAEASAERLAALAGRSLVAADEAERAQTLRVFAGRALASARFSHAAARHELEMAQAALRFGEAGQGEGGSLPLPAPVSGVVLRRHYESARPVQAGEHLFEIGDPSRLEAEIEVLSSDAVRLREGMAVELLRWGEPEVLPARVQRIEPGAFTKVSALGVEEQRVLVIVDFTGPAEQWQRLGDAYRVNARFILQEAVDVVRVPAGAIFRHGEGYAVFRVENGRARLVPVQTGLSGGGWTEIVAGLDEEDTVVVHPVRELVDGDRVRAR